MAFVEPTSYALLALAAAPDHPDAVEAAVRWLLGEQNPDGGWGSPAGDGQSGWATAAAVRALSGVPQAQAAVSNGARWLRHHGSRSVNAPPNNAVTLDASLTGWGWTPGTLGWVVPTSLGMLALLSVPGLATPHDLEPGLQLLLNRQCEGGGWNWGNAHLFGAPLPATVQETALAVLALLAAGQDAASAAAAGGLDWLGTNARPPSGTAALAWAVLALRAGGRSAETQVQHLLSSQGPDGAWSGDPRATALAVLALEGVRP